jgi:ABC-type uncharacterized transport system permease subunit
MPILWLRVALGFYAVGLVYALLALSRREGVLNRIATPAMAFGMAFQFVALTESVLLSGLTLTSVHNAESLLSVLVMAAFMLAYLIYRTASPGIVVFPLVFLLTAVAATGQQPFLIASSVMARGWLFAHITLVMAGYAALFLSFSASLLYLMQEHNLKSKSSGGLLSRLPALQVLDDLGYRSLLLGFPCMTVGLILGLVMAEATYHRIDYLDPKIFLSLLTWAVYLVLVYTRWNAGWRGRKAAYLAAGAFATALVAWAANYFSAIHRFVRS